MEGAVAAVFRKVVGSLLSSDDSAAQSSLDPKTLQEGSSETRGLDLGPTMRNDYFLKSQHVVAVNTVQDLHWNPSWLQEFQDGQDGAKMCQDGAKVAPR